VDLSDTPSNGVRIAKARLRRNLLAARDALGQDGRVTQAQAITDGLLDWAPVRDLPPGATIAAFVGVGTEPSTTELLVELHRQGRRVLLPRWRPGSAEIDWVLYTGPDHLASAAAGLLEPTGDALGMDALARAAVILVPALAVDHAGNRLGRGAGAYDAALRRVAGHARICALLYTGELVDHLPVEPHDRPVSAVALPAGVIELGPA
jgi:5-formyltetrahydrofolate cyclo-ligase